MPSYAAYGLGIESEISLPELLESDAPADVLIRKGHVARVPMRPNETDDYVRLSNDSVSFETPHGRFLMTAARELTVDPSPGIDPSTLRLVVLGRALGALLQWQGRFVLHASAVARDGRVRIFAGESGAGKSTTAAAHMALGYELVADDLVAIDLAADAPRVLPAHPQMKLWPDAARALGIAVDDLDRVHRDHDKRIIPLDATRLVRASLPIESIAILARGAPSRVERLAPQDALVELLRHAYAPRIMRALGREPELFAQCSRLARSLDVRRAIIDRNPGTGPDISALLELHMTGT